MNGPTPPNTEPTVSPEAVRTALATTHRLINELGYIVGYGELLLRHVDAEGAEMARELAQAAQDAAASAAEVHALLTPHGPEEAPGSA